MSTLKRGLSVAIKPRSMECCRDVCPVDFSYLHIRSWSSNRVTIRFLVTSLTKALLHQLLSLARRPALGRVLLFQTSSIKGIRDYMLLWPFNEADFFSELFPRCVAWRKPVSELYRQFFWPRGLVFFSDMHYQLLDLLLRHVCLSKSYPFNWICHSLTSLEV